MTECMTAAPAVAENGQAARTASRVFTPRVDVWETDQEFLFQADLPGVQPGDLELNFENGTLTLRGRVQPAQAQPSLLREYAVGDYFRHFSIHDDVDVGAISAEFRHGSLTVKLPKREEIKPRRIAIAG